MTTQANTTPLSTVIGVFPAQEQADQAIDALRHTHFRYDHIRVVERGMGGFGDTLKGMFTGQAAVASNTADNLVKMGLPEYEAQYYQNELDADHVLVLMNADDRPEEAFSVMRQNGAFDIQLRLRMSSADDTMTRRSAQDAQQQMSPQAQMPPQSPQQQMSPMAATPAPVPADPRYTNRAQADYDSATQQVPPASAAETDPELRAQQ